MKRIATLLLTCSCLLPLWAGGAATDTLVRPRVAVVLSGGGAKGMAHIGAMKVIERAGIPVDIITGTSMGSIVGGLYACGWNAQALDSVVRLQDWPFLLTDRDDYYSQNLANRKKQNTYLLSKTLTIGRRNANETGGLVQGKNLAKLFDRLTAGYNDSIDFARLPIPFSCVATNIVDNTEYDFHHGSLPRAMRASMAIPAVFAPVRQDSMVLVDGGLRNNYPADLARAMGADYIIGVTVQGPAKTADELTTGASVIGQIIDVNCKNKYDENLSITDIPIRVNTTGYTPASFTPAAIDTLIRRGEETAMSQWSRLLMLKRRMGLPDNYRPTVLSPNAEALVPIDFADSLSAQHQRPPHNQVEGSLGARFDTEEMVALQLNGRYRQASKPFDLETTLRLGRNIMAAATATWQPKRLATMSLGYQFRHNSLNLYSGGSSDMNVTYNQHRIALSMLNIDVKNLSMDITAQASFYNYPRVLVSSKMQNAGFTMHSEHFIDYHATLHYNSENDWTFPTRGAKFQAEYAYVTSNFANYKGQLGFSELSASWQMSFALNRRLTFQPMLYGRMLFGTDIPQIRQNYIGGQWFGHYVEQQMPFVGVHHLERADRQFIACQLKLQEQLSTNSFLVLKVSGAQQADRTEDLLDRGPMMGYQIAYFYRTMLGPVGAALSYSNRTDEADFFVSLGFEF